MKKTIFLSTLILLVITGSRCFAKIPVYAWLSGPGDKTDSTIYYDFKQLKENGIVGIMYNAGHSKINYERISIIAKKFQLKFYAWIPALLQPAEEKIDTNLYVINRFGESSFHKPPFVSYYKFLCPNHIEVYNYLKKLYGEIIDIPSVDGIHLDYIRFPDVILAKGLWQKYNLVMDKEYGQFDYCYCSKCVNDFKEKTGIDILKEENPSQIVEWKQYRYDILTNLVNNLSDYIHSKGKKITAAVFPGPESIAKKIVRQEWNKWNLDAFFVMNYNDFYLKNTKWIGEMCREAVTSTKNKTPIYSGLFICPYPKLKDKKSDPEEQGLTPYELKKAINQSILNGATGISLFTPSRMTKEGWRELKKIIY